MITRARLGAAACGLASALASAPAGSREPPVLQAMPGPGPQREPGRIARNEACVGCHRDIADEWAASLHRGAGDDPEYLRAIEREPLRFCHTCHVPEDMARKTSAAAAAVGVACVTCHWAGPDAVLAAPGAVAPTAAAAHRVVVDPRFGDAAACAACHEFPFPDNHLRSEPAWMQRTVQEHDASWARAYACAECHMPWTDDAHGGHRSHRFAGSRDPERVALALGVAVVRTGPAAVEIRLSPGAAGHAFPTGDLFRRLEVRVQLLGEDGPYRPQVHHLGRRFADLQDLPGVVVRREVADDRLTAVPVVLEFALDGVSADTCDDPGPLWVAYRVRYQRVASPDLQAPGGARLEGEVTIAEGAVPAWDDAPGRRPGAS